MPKHLKSYKNEEKCRNYRNHQRKKNYKQTQKYDKHRWDNPREDELILKQEILDRELSEIIRRSVQSIQIRRSRLKAKLKED